MEDEEQLFAMRKASQNVIDSAQKTIEALNGAIAQQRSMAAGLQNIAATTASQAGQGARAGVQEAIKQAATLDLGPQIKSAVQPTLDSIKTGMSNLNSATAEAERAARALAAHKLNWKEVAVVLLCGFIFGAGTVWVLVKGRIDAIEQTLENSTVEVKQTTQALPPAAGTPGGRRPTQQGKKKTETPKQDPPRATPPTPDPAVPNP